MINVEDIKVGSYFYFLNNYKNINHFCWQVVEIKRRLPFSNGKVIEFDDVYYIVSMTDKTKLETRINWRKKTR